MRSYARSTATLLCFTGAWLLASATMLTAIQAQSKTAGPHELVESFMSRRDSAEFDKGAKLCSGEYNAETLWRFQNVTESKQVRVEELFAVANEALAVTNVFPLKKNNASTHYNIRLRKKGETWLVEDMEIFGVTGGNVIIRQLFLREHADAQLDLRSMTVNARRLSQAFVARLASREFEEAATFTSESYTAEVLRKLHYGAMGSTKAHVKDVYVDETHALAITSTFPYAVALDAKIHVCIHLRKNEGRWFVDSMTVEEINGLTNLRIGFLQKYPGVYVVSADENSPQSARITARILVTRFASRDFEGAGAETLRCYDRNALGFLRGVTKSQEFHVEQFYEAEGHALAITGAFPLKAAPKVTAHYVITLSRKGPRGPLATSRFMTSRASA